MRPRRGPVGVAALVALVAAGLAAGACKEVGGGDLPTSPPPTSDPTPGSGSVEAPRRIQIPIEAFAFVAPGGGTTITAQVGDTIEFVNRDAAPHTVTSTAGTPSFDSGRMNQNAVWRLVVTTPGTFPFICDFHPAMTGTLIVQAATGGPPPSNPPPSNPPPSDPPPSDPPPADPPPAGAITVDMRDDRFIGPDGTSRIVAAPGQTVEFVNRDDSSHTATSTSGTPSFDSGTMRFNARFQLVQGVPGTWTFICDFHSDMTGTLVVQAGGAPPPGTPPPGNPPPGNPPPGGGAGTVVVTITDAGFSGGGNVVIDLGQAVEWVNAGSGEHELDSTDEPDDAEDFRSGDLGPGDRFRFVPTRTGTWVYRCKEHGNERDMTITVR